MALRNCCANKENVSAKKLIFSHGGRKSDLKYYCKEQFWVVESLSNVLHCLLHHHHVQKVHGMVRPLLAISQCSLGKI